MSVDHAKHAVAVAKYAKESGHNVKYSPTSAQKDMQEAYGLPPISEYENPTAIQPRSSPSSRIATLGASEYQVRKSDR